MTKDEILEQQKIHLDKAIATDPAIQRYIDIHEKLSCRWISVKDRMPPPEQCVIGLGIDHDLSPTRRRVCLTTWTCDEEFNKCKLEITHWMEIPPLPKQEDE